MGQVVRAASVLRRWAFCLEEFRSLGWLFLDTTPVFLTSVPILLANFTRFRTLLPRFRASSETCWPGLFLATKTVEKRTLEGSFCSAHSRFLEEAQSTCFSLRAN